MSDRSLVAPIALGIALTGWPAACNADGNLGIIFSDIITSSPRIDYNFRSAIPVNTDFFGPGVTGVCLYLLLKKDEDWSDERSHVTSRHVVLEVCLCITHLNHNQL